MRILALFQTYYLLTTREKASNFICYGVPQDETVSFSKSNITQTEGTVIEIKIPCHKESLYIRKDGDSYCTNDRISANYLKIL